MSDLFIDPPEGMCKAVVHDPKILSFGMAIPAITCNKESLEGSSFCADHQTLESRHPVKK